MKITKEPFGTLKDGTAVTRYTMENEHGMKVSVLDYGATVQSILVPNEQGGFTDVALGYDDAAGYEAGSSFLGAFVGRYANRLKGAAFTLNGRTYQLEKNDGNNHLHGTFCRTLFDVKELEDGLLFTHTFPDGEEGYPGTLTVKAYYRMPFFNILELEYFAETDADTVINLTNHTYFNLNGSGTILDHLLMSQARSFTEANAETIPTGNILPVQGTPMDFRLWKPIGRDIHSDYEQLRQCKGYDHNFILSDSKDGIKAGAFQMAFCARGDLSGIEMTCMTTQPAMQLYTGNFVGLDAAPCGKGGVRYPQYGGFCLETQNYPCAPNFENFPNAVLRPGETYHQKTSYIFTLWDRK